MDPITHAASGAVAMLALPRRPLTRWAVPLAALAAASPDLDLVFVSTPLQFLLLHRGITHSPAAVTGGMAGGPALRSLDCPGSFCSPSVVLFCPPGIRVLASFPFGPPIVAVFIRKAAQTPGDVNPPCPQDSECLIRMTSP